MSTLTKVAPIAPGLGRIAGGHWAIAPIPTFTAIATNLRLQLPQFRSQILQLFLQVAHDPWFDSAFATSNGRAPFPVGTTPNL